MKKSLIAIAMMLAAAAVNAEAMYWQVNTLNTNAKDYTMAQVRVYNNGQATENYLSVLDEGTGDWVQNGVVGLDGAKGAWFDLTGYNTDNPVYSFVLELVNDNFEVMGASAQTSYANLGAGVVQNFDTIAPLTYTSWNAGYVDIPEPTSSLMLLLGVSMLALRRKRI